jgi:hypothetical protein
MSDTQIIMRGIVEVVAIAAVGAFLIAIATGFPPWWRRRQ